jgi:hypothetical protein
MPRAGLSVKSRQPFRHVIPGRAQSEQTRNPEKESVPASGFRARRYLISGLLEIRIQ